MSMVQCTICAKKIEEEEGMHLSICAIGSEGIITCDGCRSTLAELVRGMMHACGRARRHYGWESGKGSKA